MQIRNKLKKLIKPLYQYPPAEAVIDNCVKLTWNSRLLRKWFTRNFSSGYLAIGEKNKYCIAPEWITVDMDGADFNYDLRDAAPLPFTAASIECIFTSHMVEHLPPHICQYFFAESFRLLKPGGVIRIEAPDAEKIISEYQAGNDQFFIDILNDEEKKQLGKDLAIHDVFMGLLSCYIDKDKHVAVKVTKQEVDDKIKHLSRDDFLAWCISLQSPEQIQSGGHIHPIYFDKVRRMLTEVGYRHTYEVKVDDSKHKLLKKKLPGIQRTHRANYSTYIEAIKPE